MYYTKGGISLDKLECMPFNRFEKYLKEALRIQKEFEDNQREK